MPAIAPGGKESGAGESAGTGEASLRAVVGIGIDVNVKDDVVDTPSSATEGIGADDVVGIVKDVVVGDVVDNADVVVAGDVAVVGFAPVVVEDAMVAPDAEVVSVVVVVAVVAVETGTGTASPPGADVELICKSGTGNPKQ
jgi:hypothetical protein